MTDLEGKVAVVTGGTRGIGWCIAEALLGENASVFICGRDGEALKTALEKLGRDPDHLVRKAAQEALKHIRRGPE